MKFKFIGFSLSAAALCVLSFIACLALSAPAFAQDVSATIIALEGDVTVKTDDSAEWKPAAINQQLRQGAYIMTAFESNCEIEFMDKSKMKIRELSKIQVNKFTSELKKVDTEVTLYNGKVRATVHKDVDKNTNFQVKTPVSTISVRGTEKEITVHPGFGTEVHTITGVVEVSNNIGQKVNVAKNETTTVKTETSVPDSTSRVITEDAKVNVTNQSLTTEEKKFVETFTDTRTEVKTTSEEVKQIFEETKREFGRLTVRWK
jgi:hypothetical protein